MRLLITCAVLALLGLQAFIQAASTGSGVGPDSQPGPAAPTRPETSTPAETKPPEENPPVGAATLTGDWQGWRTRVSDWGISFAPTYQAEVLGNTGGHRQGVISDGVFNLPLEFDLGKLTGFWKDATFHVNALHIYGSNPTSKYVRDISGVSNISGYNSLRLQELWLEQKFWEQRLSIRTGLLAADTEFFGAETAAIFINSTFGVPNLLALSIPDAPIYPVANPGVRLSFDPSPSFYLKTAVFGMDTNSDATRNNQHGTHLHINSSDGVFFLGEAGYLINHTPESRGLASAFKLGGYAQHGDFPTFQSQADDALGTGDLSGKGTQWGVYVIADQQLYRAGEKKISAFMRGGFAPKSLSFVDKYADAGLNFIGFVAGRSDDILGVAVGYSHISGEFSDSEAAQGNPKSSYETTLEATYKFAVTPWWSLQPDLQYIFNAGGFRGARDAFVAGLRTTIAF